MELSHLQPNPPLPVAPMGLFPNEQFPKSSFFAQSTAAPARSWLCGGDEDKLQLIQGCSCCDAAPARTIFAQTQQQEQLWLSCGVIKEILRDKIGIKIPIFLSVYGEICASSAVLHPSSCGASQGLRHPKFISRWSCMPPASSQDRFSLWSPSVLTPHRGSEILR